ncbi:MAG: radical SAM protein [Myxococcales bacterium]|nr:radical SAM protein [Myxococcales bacterium]MCB9580103.1 radical SAM protein [Polyangiaceae bacterium]
MNRSLPELTLSSSRPGHPDWEAVRKDALERANAIGPTLEAPMKGAAELSRRTRSMRQAARNYWDNRALLRQGRGDLRPLYFIWTTLRPCNFRCSYCDDHQGQRYPELSGRGVLDTSQGKDLLRVMRTRTPSVYFAGGEPTLRKDLPVLTRTARDLDYYPIVVNTNGSLFHRLLTKPEWRGFLADVDILVVSLDALDLGLLADMWQTPKPEHVIRNLLLLRALAEEQRVKLMVNTVIQPGLIHEARAVLDLADDLGIWFCPVPRNRGPRIDPEVLADPHYEPFVKTILARKRAGRRVIGTERMNDRLLHAKPYTCMNTLKPHIDHDGRLAWPCKASVEEKPTYVPVLDFPDVDSLYEHARQLIDPAGFSDRCGAACNWAQNYSTDEYAHGLRHPLSLLGAVGGFLSA